MLKKLLFYLLLSPKTIGSTSKWYYCVIIYDKLMSPLLKSEEAPYKGVGSFT